MHSFLLLLIVFFVSIDSTMVMILVSDNKMVVKGDNNENQLNGTHFKQPF